MEDPRCHRRRTGRIPVALAVAFLFVVITVVANLLMMPTIAFGKPAICIDQSHDFRFALAWQLRDVLAEGFAVTVSLASINCVDLQQYDVLVVPIGTSVPFTEVEKQQIEEFIAAGGGLFVIGYGVPSVNWVSSLRDLTHHLLPTLEFSDAEVNDGSLGFITGRFDQGQILAATDALLSTHISQDAGKSTINELVRSIVREASRTGTAGVPSLIYPENRVEVGNFTVFYSEHLSGNARIIINNLDQVCSLLAKYHGEPLVVRLNLLLLPTAGSRYASADEIAVGALGDEANILAVLAHELTHVWVRPAVLPSSFNEGWATLAAQRVVAALGYTDYARLERAGYGESLRCLEEKQGPLNFYDWPNGPPQEMVPAYMGKAMNVIEDLEKRFGPELIATVMARGKHHIRQGVLRSPLSLDELASLFTEIVGDDLDVYGMFQGGWYVKFQCPVGNAKVRGPLTVRLKLPRDTLLSRIAVELDGAPIYSGQAVPQNLVIDTLTITDGSHTLAAAAWSSDGREAVAIVSFVVDNWWELVDDLLAPLPWFGGTIDRSLTSAATPGWRYTSDSPVAFAGDEHRVVRTDNTHEYLVWSTPWLGEFQAVLYATSASVTDYIEISVSRDGQDWRVISFTTAFAPIPDSEWIRCELTGQLRTSDQAHWFKLAILPGPFPPDCCQLGKVRFIGRTVTLAPKLGGVQGLSGRTVCLRPVGDVRGEVRVLS